MAEATENALVTTEQASNNPVVKAMQGMNRLPFIRQLGLMIGLAASVAIGVAVVLWSQAPNYSILFSGLEQKDSAAVADALQKSSVQYKIDQATGAIMVPSRDLHELRLKLASQGLPNGGTQGLEMLQNDSGFGTSQFIESARYYRAMEIELTRSIETLSTVQSARVHLAIPKQSVFVRQRELPSASVIVHLYSGRSLEDGQVSAITHMVSSSVPNLLASQVTVIDQTGRLLTAPKRSADMQLSADQFEYSKKVEQSYAERIANILSPVAGMEGVRAQVTADLDFSVTEQTQELYNPDAPALRSQQASEELNNGPLDAGVPGALSNQPPGAATVPQAVGQPAQAGAQTAAPGKTRKNSTSNYELDKTISHTRMSPGRVMRLSVAVVVDDRLLPNGQRRPHSPEEMERLTQLVRDAVGYNAQRGDSVSVTNLAFNAPVTEAIPEAAFWEQPWFWDIAKQVLAGLAILALVFGVLRPMMRNLAHRTVVTTTTGAAAAGVTAGGGAALEGSVADDRLTLTSGASTAQPLLPPTEKQRQDLIEQARSIADAEPALVAQIMKGWVNED